VTVPASKEQQAKVAERRYRALRLRSQGLSYEAIAKTLQLPSARAAAMDVLRALDDRQELLDRESTRFIALEMERLESQSLSIEQVIVRAVNNGDDAMILAANDRLLRIAQRRSRLLGLDREVVGRPQPQTDMDELRSRRERKKQLSRGRAV
jgi:DNA-binding transcriptional MerR regulator